ncbi:hypothetical protein PVAND_009531 [Polypedilum vanderplanki]|uniref:Protein phosphatase 1 regulatory subunit 21 N-terminal domain-containing protein n=1 Tax=Polypedilum vanderplanki TaxID=319348 RepID=A0A9J6CEE7_POLVA|nr:hypothetical protein PVAND_009531 [Polypedilum vanderplanki]
MEDEKNGQKYVKLLAEYTKLRTQAKVLKNAVVEERNKVSVLQESLRIKDQNLRRVETEFDSVNFRNKQLEHRVASLQDDLQASQKTNKGNASKINKMRNDNQITGEIDPIWAEELQKKIIESATLASTISDKNNEIEMYVNRIKDLETQLSKQMNNNNEIEKKLRKEIEVLTVKNTELETKIIEATSQLGSEGDSTSLASDSTMPISNVVSSANTNHTDDRIAFLEKELNHYRTQYELLKINDALRMDEHLMAQTNLQLHQNNNNNNSSNQSRKVLSSQSSTSSSMSNNNNNHSTFVNYPTSSQSSGSKSSPCQNSKSLPNEQSASMKCGNSVCADGEEETVNRDQVVYDYFSKRFEELFQEKCKAESKVLNYIAECESLKNNIELLIEDNEEKDRKYQELQASFVRLEEDFVTTRVNYEEQICVLTDQVINLSDQLATR